MQAISRQTQHWDLLPKLEPKVCQEPVRSFPSHVIERSDRVLYLPLMKLGLLLVSQTAIQYSSLVCKT
jgi:hypothetical protein